MTRSDLQKIVNDYGRTHQKVTTMDMLNHLKASIRDAVYDGYLKKDPIHKIRITSQVEHKERLHYLEDEEVRKLVGYFNEHEDDSFAVFCHIVLDTGMRYAEALAITGEDIDKENQLISVNKTYDYKETTDNRFMPTKNTSSVRQIKVSYKTLRLLELLKNRYELNDKEPIGYYATAHKKSGRVFNSTVNMRLAKYCKEVGIRRITVHGLRHTYASLLISHGVSIQSVANLLGHSDTITTQKTYIHLLKELQQKDNNRVMDILNSLEG